MSDPHFAELHARSTYAFLTGASTPQQLVDQARELGLDALCMTDRDGFYGAVQFAQAAADAGLSTVFGAELSLEPAPLTILCRGQEGYRRLSRVISDAHLRAGEKGVTAYPPLSELATLGGEHWVVVATYEWIDHLAELANLFPQVVVELTVNFLPTDSDHHEQLLAAAHRHHLDAIVATAAVAADPSATRLAGAKAALARREELADARPHLHPLGGSFLHSPAEIAAMFPDHPELLDNTVQLARQCAFELDLIAPELPNWDVPDGHDENSWLQHQVYQRAPQRYGRRHENPAAWRQLDAELTVIRELNFPGYFLIVMDLVDFCRRANILAQGRGSSANSAVCFALGITAVDPVAAGLLFERFLSPERDGPPDIDVDIESGRREEVIQYCYQRYGRECAAQVANVITYRHRGAIRDAGRALGHPAGRIDAWVRGNAEVPADVATLADGLLGQPRHLGIHSGGMVICDRPIADVVPVEWARMAGRTVVQWDKDDCAATGLVKFDLLGLGMLEALHRCQDQVRTHRGRTVELWQLGFEDPQVYEMLAKADAVGVFQVESRAQMNALPRLKPSQFYDLVVQVALIRPGPIQGGSVHPFIRRRNGQEAITFDHPCLREALSRTLGVPLFQEQVMRVAVDAAGFTAGEADSLRRAMGSKRSARRMQQLRDRFADGCRRLHGMNDETIEALWTKIIAFASYGFPESHAQSFASLVYFSAWFKRYYPAEFCASLLQSQPMGFYSPQSLIADAARHGVTILPVDINASEVHAEALDTPDDESPGSLRLGLASIKAVSERMAQKIVDARDSDGPFTSVADISRRTGVSVTAMESLASSGALESLGLDRRQAIWAAGIAASERPGMLPGMSDIVAPALPGMTDFELAAADIATTGMSATGHPVRLIRRYLQQRDILSLKELAQYENGRRLWTAGAVTHRQKPGTARGVRFLGLEDETGLGNVLVEPEVWEKYFLAARNARIALVRGIVYNESGATTLVADRIEAFDAAAALAHDSRDFR